MRAIWVLAKKELRLLFRDRLAAGLLVLMPLLFILILGLLLGEGFGQKPDDTLQLSIVDADEGIGINGKPWAHWVYEDLRATPGIRLERIPSIEEAEHLVRQHRRAAVLILQPDFSVQMNRCSFLDTKDSLNPFHREGVYLDRVGVRFLKDPTQTSAAAIIEQVVQVSMLRVILPYMIGQAFVKLSDDAFIARLGEAVNLPMPADFPVLVNSAEDLMKDSRLKAVRAFDSKLNTKLKTLEDKLKKFKPLVAKNDVQLDELINLAAGGDKAKAADYRDRVGKGVQKALKKQFNKYDLTGMTWTALTKSQAGDGSGAQVAQYQDRDGSGLLKRGAQRYQVLVPAYTVMFAFFLVLTVGWVFVAERRQGTLKRLRAAPITRLQILLGKLVPCYLLSLGQGMFLLIAGRLLFGMQWGPDTWPWWQQGAWVLIVIMCTSLAAMGLALLVASIAKSEVQVALYGAVPVLVLALIGGCILPREMMPEQTRKLSLLTPQGWALDAYRELLGTTTGYEPNVGLILQACGVLAAFGAVFLALAWGLLRLE